MQRILNQGELRRKNVSMQILHEILSVFLLTMHDIQEKSADFNQSSYQNTYRQLHGPLHPQGFFPQLHGPLHPHGFCPQLEDLLNSSISFSAFSLA